MTPQLNSTALYMEEKNPLSQVTPNINACPLLSSVIHHQQSFIVSCWIRKAAAPPDAVAREIPACVIRQ